MVSITNLASVSASTAALLALQNQPDTGSSFTESKNTTINLKRPAKVVIFKKVRTIPEPGSQDYDAMYASGSNLVIPNSPDVLFKEEYEEFLKPVTIPELQLFRKVSLLVRNTAIEDYYRVSVQGIEIPLYHFYQLTIENPASKDSAGSFDLLTNPLIGGISGIRVERNIDNGSTASITIRNPLEVFNFRKNPLRYGTPVIEPQDIVHIYLPDIFDRLVRRFTGLVTEVNQSTISTGDTIQHTLEVFCEDHLKVLKMNRTNTRPSTNTREALAPIIATQIPFANMRAHEILQKVFGEAYCDLLLSPGYADELHSIRLSLNAASSASQESISSRREYELRQGLLQHGPGFITQTISAKDAQTQQEYQSLLQSLRSTDISTSIQEISLAQKKATVSGIVPTLIVGNFTPQVVVDPETVQVFRITGLDQPIYQLIFAKDWDFFQSEWQSNAAISSEIAGKVFFELYTSPSGTVIFRPFNPNLPSTLQNVDLYTVKSDDVTTDQIYSKDNRPSTLYRLPRKLITSESYSDSDRDLATVLYTRGQYEWTRAEDTPWNVSAVVDTTLVRKYGTRAGQEQRVFNLTDPVALREYGRAVMDKINSNKYTGTITMKADARIDIGNYCYLNWRTSCYYITRISETYAPGGGYDATLELRYGRKPIAFTYNRALGEGFIASSQGYGDLSTIIQKKSFINVLADYLTQDKIDPLTKIFTDGNTAYERLRKGALAALPGHQNDTSFNSNRLILDGFVWEDLTDLIYDRAASVQAANLFVESSKATTEQTKSIVQPTSTIIPTSQ